MVTSSEKLAKLRKKFALKSEEKKETVVPPEAELVVEKPMTWPRTVLHVDGTQGVYESCESWRKAAKEKFTAWLDERQKQLKRLGYVC